MRGRRWIEIIERAANSAEAMFAWDRHSAIHMIARGYQRCPTCGEWAGVLPIGPEEISSDDDPCLRCARGMIVQGCEDCERLQEQYLEACTPEYE